ncbi:MAG TPA: hypothetical protein VF132_01195, partial [Rudaea sp.]
MLGLVVAAGLALTPAAFARTHLSVGVAVPGVAACYNCGYGYYGPSYYSGYYAPAPVYYSNYYAPYPV